MPSIATSTTKAKALEEDDAAPPQSASTRKTRPLRRKTSHSVIERRRREKINERLIRLQESVPACRQEAQEMLSSKLSNVKGKKRLAEADRQEEIERRIKQEMVLEKLCIISHTVGACCEPICIASHRSDCDRWD
ncbi:STEROL REGULATORY ELEMENT-BINDING PROTEIN [Ceraceosorus bombacis]|uniref:STEROL REGULATORY ELEMENT-BINDING PROTEIN n=1 Tax=Ceraceosorus bombacis TaxID=401625 RepID=A0A0P1BAB6_9BASI|nr:STEROL REGULATORY ELEMENT-BINDING PROTEIN [Ceraceosorus bombacis]